MVDGSHRYDILGHAIGLAMRNDSFRPADQTTFLARCPKILFSAAHEKPPISPLVGKEKKEEECQAFDDQELESREMGNGQWETF